MVLLKNWHDALPEILAGEQQRRINAVFPPGAQARVALGIALGHPDAADPAEVRRGWDYIVAVEAAGKTLATKGSLNPCDDSNWPKIIDPIKV
jgi:hypothetical protein